MLFYAIVMGYVSKDEKIGGCYQNRIDGLANGRYWDRTSGLFGVNEALSR